MQSEPLLFALPLENALDEGRIPIRDVARQTGVNAVTLRAWERRYGLVVPHRTAKGHRLYDAQHVARIQQILTWLNRGVAVSQVRELLDTADEDPLPPAHNDWHPLLHQLLQAINDLAERRVDEVFNQAMSLYPPVTVCEHLLLPLLDTLEQRWQGQFGAQLERVFFHSWLRSKLGARLYHNNRQLSGAPLLLVNQSNLAMDPHLWLTAWLASTAGCPVEVFDWPLPGAELALAVDKLSARGVLLYASQALNLAQLHRLLGACRCAKLIVGPAVRIHFGQWHVQAHEIAELTLADTPVDALHSLQQLGLLKDCDR